MHSPDRTIHSGVEVGRKGAEPAQAPVPPPRAAARRVLVVDDERRLREMLVASLKEIGLEPTGAATAEAGLRLLGESAFGIALVDLNLPGMGGLEFCEAVRQRWPSTQLIILTGFGDLAAARKAIRMDVVDFLTKPCGMDELEVALARARVRWMEQWMEGGPPSPAERQPGKPRVPPRVEPAPQSPQPAAAPAIAPAADAVTGSTLSLQDMERQLILAALARHGGNREAAADELGISVRKLYYRLQQYQRDGHATSGG